MTQNIITPKKSGRSTDIPTGVPEPDQVASGRAGTGQENISYPGIQGNIILFPADRHDAVAERQNKKIRRLEQRLAKIEERERSL